MTKDPVCGMSVDERSAPHQSTYESRTYFFCGPGCKASFDKNPAKYVGSTVAEGRT